MVLYIHFSWRCKKTIGTGCNILLIGIECLEWYWKGYVMWKGTVNVYILRNLEIPEKSHFLINLKAGYEMY